LNEAELDAPTCEIEDPTYFATLDTVWDELRKDFVFSKGVNNSRVRRHLAIYDRRQKYFNTINERAEKYLFYVKEEVKKRGMPAEIALLPVIESGLDPFAYSHGRAAGMWQFIPSTAKIFKLESSWWYEGRRDVVASTDAALNYLERLHKRFDGDWLLALAAYNSGSGTVYREQRQNTKLGLPTDYWSLDLPKETKDYVPKLIALSQLVADPEKYSIALWPIPNAPYFDQVDPKGQIDLSQAAYLALVSTEDIYLLNPGFNRWATEPSKNRHLLVPHSNAFIFEENLNSLPTEERLAWERYTIESGDSLSTIAENNHINISFLKSVNNLSNNTIRAGQTLLIPKPLGKASSYQLSQEQRTQALRHKQKTGKKRLTHVVEKNHSFWSISKEYNVGIRELAKWNGMAPGDTLRENQRLNVWVNDDNLKYREVYRKVYYTVRNGDNLSSIATRFNVAVNDIKQWNDLQNQKYLKPGQKLTLNVNVAK
jgi:membrane-bound lytic murein transglycosylase D